MSDSFSRTQLLFGPAAMEKLRKSRIAVFGIGGVGGYAVEALVRSGIGALDLIDHDRFCLSNLNRQILATRITVGRYKVDVAEERIRSINPDCFVRTYKTFFLPGNRDLFDFSSFDYVIDAIDTVTGKMALIETAGAAGTPLISCMGTGNKINPAALRVADIYQTSVCPLARIIRSECRRRNIRSLKVVYSPEPPISPREHPASDETALSQAGQAIPVRKDIPGSTAFVPAAAGLIIASEVVRDLILSVRS